MNTATTSNKPLNFVQHVKTLLKQNGRAVLVLPDNMLFEGGAGFDETHPQPGPLPVGEGMGSSGRWRAYDYDELVSRDKASLDIFWLKDESLSEVDAGEGIPS